MKKIFYLALLLVVYVTYAEEISVPEQPVEQATIPEQSAEMPQPVVVPVVDIEPPVAKVPPVTLDTLLHSKLLLESMQELISEPDKQLQIYFPKNAKNTLLVMELQDKLVALGLPSERIQLSADEDQDGEFLFEIVERTPYQEVEAEADEVEQEQEQESESESEQEQE